MPARGSATLPAATRPADPSACTSRRPRAPGPTRLCGLAENAKGGAVIVLDDGAVVYILGLESWPDELHRKRILASGGFARRKLIPDPPPPDQPQAQGAFGAQSILDGASWQLAK
jgi:hypothetical protein